ncbi:hypothetical protein OU798_07880 [Prolixibacteraceae bacterium Z1-6]|uniref:Riboflavin synthase subunit beta n=1 Tax=Draconibacterium aestuarii TaxID=2998507 RepID=A0A9X3F4D6_9BACT|nr:hypothetical protein [Prolixibacteraceae bacterium Z1-6]
MISNFFHTPGTKKFRISPRFYDPDKEERDERERRIKEELGIVEEKVDDGKPYRPSIKGQFRSGDGWAKSSESARKAQNRRLIWIILILALVVYLFFYSDFFSS